MPGLVNAHTHLDLSHCRRRLTLPNDFVSWILELIPLRRQMEDREIDEAVRTGVREALRAGTTTIGDITRSGESIPVLDDAGCRSVLFLEVIGRSGETTPQWIANLKTKIIEMEDRSGEKVTIGLSPHTPYTLSAERMQALAAYLKEKSLPYAMHIAESEAEAEYFRHHSGELKSRLFPVIGWEKAPNPEGFGTPLGHVREMGLLSDHLVVVHGVHLTTEDIDRLKETGARVAHCPRSNHFLQVGAAPIRKLLQKGIPVGLGTDSLASNTSLSLWEEIRFLRDRFSEDPFITAERLLSMATLGGAEALGLADKIGSIEEGKEADLIVVECRGKDGKELAARLIEQTTSDKIRMVMVAGEKLPLQ